MYLVRQLNRQPIMNTRCHCAAIREHHVIVYVQSVLTGVVTGKLLCSLSLVSILLMHMSLI